MDSQKSESISMLNEMSRMTVEGTTTEDVAPTDEKSYTGRCNSFLGGQLRVELYLRRDVARVSGAELGHGRLVGLAD